MSNGNIHLTNVLSLNKDRQNLIAIEIAYELGDAETISFGQLNLVDCYLATGRLDDAEAHLAPVIKESQTNRTLGDQWMRWRYLQHLSASRGELALKKGDPAGPVKWADDCVEAAE